LVEKNGKWVLNSKERNKKSLIFKSTVVFIILNVMVKLYNEKASCSFDQVLWAIGALVIVNIDRFDGNIENKIIFDLVLSFCKYDNHTKSMYECLIKIFFLGIVNELLKLYSKEFEICWLIKGGKNEVKRNV
jgi:hypothetical protein